MPSEEGTKIEGLLTKLLAANLYSFPKIGEKLSDLSIPHQHGVYIIYDPNNEVVHVGRTQRGRHGLYQRLNNHLQGKSSFTRQYLKGDSKKLRTGYKFKYLIVENPRERALLEALTIGKLCPKHLGLGE